MALEGQLSALQTDDMFPEAHFGPACFFGFVLSILSAATVRPVRTDTRMPVTSMRPPPPMLSLDYSPSG